METGKLVELVGIEPTASSLRMRTSANLSHSSAYTSLPSTVHYGPIQQIWLPVVASTNRRQESPAGRLMPPLFFGARKCKWSSQTNATERQRSVTRRQGKETEHGKRHGAISPSASTATGDPCRVHRPPGSGSSNSYFQRTHCGLYQPLIVYFVGLLIACGYRGFRTR
jgi:hypothetical protein